MQNSIRSIVCFFLLAMFSLALAQQSSVNLQRQGTCPASSSTQIVIALPSTAKMAASACLVLDPAGFVVDSTTSPPTVRLKPLAGINFMDDDAACTSWLTSTTYALAHPPNPPSSLSIVQNGVTLKQGLDFTLSGSTVTFLFNAPAATDALICRYRY